VNTLSLPPAAPNPARAAAPPELEPKALSILIVEDEPGDHALVVTYLRHKSFRRGASSPNLVWAKSLGEALAAAQSTVFDMVLLDLSLPDSAGVQTVSAITAALKGTPVVVLTGNDDDELAMAALGAGAQDYLVKGEFDQRALGRAVRYAMARAAQERRLHLFEVALNSAANGIVVTDIDGTIQWANEAFAQMTGFSIAEAVGHRPSQLVKSGAQNQAFYQQMWQTILAGQIWRGEVINRRKDGTPYNELLAISPVLGGDGAVKHFVAIKQDISQRKHIEQRLELALVGADLGLWDLQLPSGELHLSAKVCAMLGYPEGGIGAHISKLEKLVHPDDAPSRRAALNTHLSGDARDFQAEHRMRHMAGHWVWVRSRGRVVDRDDHSAPLRVVGTVQDISQEKQLKLEGADLLLRIESLIHGFGKAPVTSERRGDAVKSAGLGPRQQQVLQLIAAGCTSAEIGEHMGITPTTAATHRRNLMRKLDLHSAAELTRYAITHKLISG
jgi:PAS domain S-box-containing protein